MDNKFIKARRMDLISKLIKEEDSKFTSKVNSILPEDLKLVKLTSDLILIKKENGFDFGFSKDAFFKTGGNPVNLERLFDPLISSYVPKMKEDIISLLEEKKNSGVLITDIDPEEFITLDHVQELMQEKLKLVKWANKKLSLSSVRALMFGALIFSSISLFMFIKILSFGYVYGLTSFLAALFYAVIVSVSINMIYFFATDYSPKKKKALARLKNLILTNQAQDLLSLKEGVFKDFKLITLELEDQKINEFSEKEIANVYDYFFHQTDDEDNKNKDEDLNESTDNYDENLFMLFVELNN
jgi:hypothetical protein